MKFDEIEVREEEIPNEEEEEALYLSPLKKQFNHMRNAEREQVQTFGRRRDGEPKYHLSECKTQPRESINSDSQHAYSDFP